MKPEDFTEEDKYCIEHFGYNTVGDILNLKNKQEKNHLIIDELEYRLKQKENNIKILRKMLEWAEECGFEFGQIFEEDVIDEDEFINKTQGMNYLNTMIFYTEKWMDKNEPDWRE